MWSPILDTSLVVAATVEVHPSHSAAAAFFECLDLVRRLDVHGKQVHDCNIVATMKVHGVRALATRQPNDFVRYGTEVEVVAIE